LQVVQFAILAESRIRKNAFGKRIYHIVYKGKKIGRELLEFRKGALRVFCFMDNEEHLTVLTHGTVKRSQKVKPAEVTAAVAAKNRYLTAKKVGQVDLVENDNE
jgi:hypothetical protein